MIQSRSLSFSLKEANDMTTLKDCERLLKECENEFAHKAVTFNGSTGSTAVKMGLRCGFIIAEMLCRIAVALENQKENKETER